MYDIITVLIYLANIYILHFTRYSEHYWMYKWIWCTLYYCYIALMRRIELSFEKSTTHSLLVSL